MTHFCKAVFYNFGHSVGDVGVISKVLVDAYCLKYEMLVTKSPDLVTNSSKIYLILAELEAYWSKFNFQSKTTVFNLIWILSEISWSLSVWILKCKLFQFRLEIYQKTMSDSMRLFTMLRIVAIVRSQDKKENKKWNEENLILLEYVVNHQPYRGYNRAKL